jgi:predicted O-linked N-acetylglucosamine transferase (SPINDLY family)
MMTVPQAFDLAQQFHGSGRLSEAEAVYRQILAVQPNYAQALHMLGVIAHQVGRHELAVDYIRRALSLTPESGTTYANLGEAYRAMNRLDEAIASYRCALDRNPNDVQARSNLGIALAGQRRFGEAIEAFEAAIRLAPGFVQAHNNLGNVLAEQLSFAAAIACYHRALELQPDYADAHYNLGFALAKLGQLSEAGAAYREALRLNPNSVEANNNLGIVLAAQGLWDEAIDAYHRALAVKPDLPETLNNLANAFRQKGRLDDAVNACRRALDLSAAYPAVLITLGSTLQDQGDLDEAISCYRRALQLQPANAELRSNIILALHFHPNQDEQAIAAEQQQWNQQIAAPVAPVILSHSNERLPERRLRIGYLSPDLYDHVVGRNLLPLFRCHDHQHFEILCYSGVINPDDVTKDFQSYADRWQSTLGLSDDTVARMIQRDSVDILVDLSQHTGCNRLPIFAYQPAPLQVSFAGYPESPGVDAIRYRISDRWLESEMEDRRWRTGKECEPQLRSPNSENRSSEQVYLIDSFWCYDPCGVEMPVNDLPAKSNSTVTFGYLGSFPKVNEKTLKLWARVLASTGDSRLLLLSGMGSHRQRTLDFLKRQGIAPGRVEFVHRRPRKEYLELYHCIDVVLDTFPYGGHTTSLDALWMGVPVVTLSGVRPVSRAGLSILSNFDLRELIAFSDDDYVRIASELGGDIQRLASLRVTLRSRLENSVIMDQPRFAQQIEAAYRSMWREWCNRAIES